MGIRNRSWLHMLNPLAKHKSQDLPTAGTGDLGGSTSVDPTGYIGKREIQLLMLLFSLRLKRDRH